MQKKNESKLLCKFSGELEPLFFSLVDYRNKLFTSNDPNKIFEFYDGFKDCDQLIRWMKERPNGAHTIYEVEGNKDVIVVIPTIDFNGRYAKECRNNIFRDIHIVFVESGEGNYYFNYAHNVNDGVRKAMEYNPKWIVVSNDDVYKIDDVNILTSALQHLDNNIFHLVFPLPPGEFHTLTQNIGTPRRFRNFILYFRNATRQKLDVESKFGIKVVTWREWYRYFSYFIYKKIKSFPITLAFTIISPYFIRSNDGILFDETYINGFEDVDISFYFSEHTQNVGWINYRIGDFIASSIGTGEFRVLTDRANAAYFQSKNSERLKANFDRHIR